MEYTKGYKFRLYPNKTQKNLLNKILGCCRFVYNRFLAVRKESWEKDKKSVGYTQTSSMLTRLKKEISWLNEADSIALQQSLRNLDTAYQNFFKNDRGYPKFKSKKNHRQTYRTVSGDKITRAEPFVAQWQAGNILLLEGKWNETFLNELEGFPDALHDDQVDAASDAFKAVTVLKDWRWA